MSRRTVAYVAAGVALVGAGVGTTFGVLALQNKRDYQKNPSYSNTDNGNNDAAYADGGIALAVAAGITSLVLFLTSDSPAAGSAAGPPKKTAAVFLLSPAVLSHGGGVGALVRF